MPEPSRTALGFDVGTRWIGSAIGQTLTQTASPLEGIRVINQKPDWQAIEKLINDWQPDLCIVGLPSSMIGKKSPMTETAKRFSRQLAGRFNLPVELIDERLTTREAWQIVEHSSQKNTRKQEIDCIAAVLITETWLHQQ